MSAGKRRGRSHRVSNVAERSYTHERHMLYDIQHGKCFICQKHVPRGEATVDHVIPQSKGGTNDFANKVMCCYACNQNKGDKSLAECKNLQLS